MDITSLLQEAPSRDRRQRKQTWEEQSMSSKPKDDHGSSAMMAVSSAHNNEHLSTVIPPNNTGGYSRNLHITADGLHNGGHPTEPPYHGAHASYYQKQVEREKDRTDLPLHPPPDYVDVQTANVTIRMRKSHLQQSQGGIDPRPYNQQIPFEPPKQNPLQAPSRSQQEYGRVLPTEVPQYNELSPLGLKQPLLSDLSIVNQKSSAQTETGLPLPPPRTPSPALDAVHLGTFVYPSLPFPIRPFTLPYNRRTTITIVIPASQLPQEDTYYPVSTNEAAPNATIHKDPRSRKIWGGIPQLDERKIYTDDSDLVFAALHSAIVPYDPELFSSGQDLELKLRLYPAPETGHFAGGLGGENLVSGSWGNSHEGCAFVITSASWVPPRTARAHSRQTRKLRMAEYAQRRATVMNTPYLTKNSQYVQPTSSSDIPHYVDTSPLEAEVSSLSIVGGWKNSLGFKYEPTTLYLMLFAFDTNAASLPPQKRRKLSESSPGSLPTNEPHPRDVIIESGMQTTDRIVLVAQRQDSVKPTDAMEVDNTVVDKIQASGSTRYDLYRESPNVSSSATNEAVIKSALKDLSSAHNIDLANKVAEADSSNGKAVKGVRFVEQAFSRPNWIRTLLHTNLGPDDIIFTPDSVIVHDNIYPVSTWRYRNHDEGSSGDVNGQTIPKKPKSSTKRRVTKKKGIKRKAAGVKGLPLATEKPAAISDEKVAEPQAPQETASAATGQQAAENKLPVEGVEKKASEVAIVEKTSKQPVTAPPPVREDKEEGELSGSDEA